MYKVLTIALFLIWGIGFFFLGAGPEIHTSLVLATAILIVKVYQEN
ncbi:DUF5670 family protein [Allomuricauda sp. d1]